jgi:metal-responsive CopG/Arc/MetJ family transcriptional regulator
MAKHTTIKGKAGEGKSMKAQSGSSVRASISFPPGLYETLEKLAKQKKVSVAWVVRDAAERYVAIEASKGRGV